MHPKGTGILTLHTPLERRFQNRERVSRDAQHVIYYAESRFRAILLALLDGPSESHRKHLIWATFRMEVVSMECGLEHFND
jgi:hypothetical protein